jgi:hypothetical protein
MTTGFDRVPSSCSSLRKRVMCSSVSQSHETEEMDINDLQTLWEMK